MCLRHLGQTGGGEFFGIALTLWDQARALPNSLSSITAEDEAMMPNLKGRRFPVVCPVADSTNRNGPKSLVGVVVSLIPASRPIAL
jgi:hypothetical protein